MSKTEGEGERELGEGSVIIVPSFTFLLLVFLPLPTPRLNLGTLLAPYLAPPPVLLFSSLSLLFLLLFSSTYHCSRYVQTIFNRVSTRSIANITSTLSDNGRERNDQTRALVARSKRNYSAPLVFNNFPNEADVSFGNGVLDHSDRDFLDR